MVLFVFEWYSIPLVLVLVLGPPVLLVAALSEIVLRKQRRTVAIVATSAVMLAFLLQVVGSGPRHDDEARAAAQTFTFIPYEPRSLPEPFALESVTVTDRVSQPTLTSRYEIGGDARATAYQKEPVGRLLTENGRCALVRREFTCRELRSPRGVRVFFDASPGMAFAVLDGTLVRLSFERLPDTAVLAYFDSLRPVDREDVELT